MNAKLIEGLTLIQAGIAILLTEGANASTVTTGAKTANAETKAEVKDNVVEIKTSKAVVASSGLNQADLDAMSYNDLKKLAKEMGIVAKGVRKDITQAMLAGAVAPVAVEDAPVEEKKPSKLGKKVVAPVVVEEEEEEEEDEEETDPVVQQVMDATADLTNEEIADILTEVGIPAKGKREALIAKVIKAVQEGKISLDDEEESEEEEEEEEEIIQDADAEEEEDEEEEEEDTTNDLENEDMTEARALALPKLDKDIRAQYKKKKLTMKAILAYLHTIFDEDDLKGTPDAEMLDLYIDRQQRLVDDAGDLTEEGAYELNGEPACCGEFLELVDGMYTCAVCDGEYEAE